jgi:hypothetical protein
MKAFFSITLAFAVSISTVWAGPRGHGRGHIMSRPSRGGATFSRGTSATFRNWSGRNWSGRNWSGGNRSGNQFIFAGGLGFPFSYGYPYYGSYPYGYYSQPAYGYGYYGNPGYDYGSQGYGYYISQIVENESFIVGADNMNLLANCSRSDADETCMSEPAPLAPLTIVCTYPMTDSSVFVETHAMQRVTYTSRCE